MKPIILTLLFCTPFALNSCAPQAPAVPPEVVEASNKIDQGLAIGVRTFTLPELTRYIRSHKGVLNNGYSLSVQNLSSTKTIKYAYVHYNLYDSVGDVVKSNLTLTCRGPIDAFNSGMYDTKNIVGSALRIMDVYRIDVEYMDGSKIVVREHDLRRGALTQMATYNTPRQLMEYRSRQRP